MAKKLLTVDLQTGQRKLETAIVDIDYNGDKKGEVSYSVEAIDSKLQELGDVIRCTTDTVIAVGSIVSYVSESENETIKVKPANYFEDRKIIGITVSEVEAGNVEVLTAGNVKGFIKQDEFDIFEKGDTCYVGEQGKIIQNIPDYIDRMQYIIPVGVLISDNIMLLDFNQDDITQISDDIIDFQGNDLISRDEIATDMVLTDNKLQLINIDGALIGSEIELPTVGKISYEQIENIPFKLELKEKAEIVLDDDFSDNVIITQSIDDKMVQSIFEATEASVEDESLVLNVDGEDTLYDVIVDERYKGFFNSLRCANSICENYIKEESAFEDAVNVMLENKKYNYGNDIYNNEIVLKLDRLFEAGAEMVEEVIYSFDYIGMQSDGILIIDAGKFRRVLWESDGDIVDAAELENNNCYQIILTRSHMVPSSECSIFAKVIKYSYPI